MLASERLMVVSVLITMMGERLNIVGEYLMVANERLLIVDEHLTIVDKYSLTAGKRLIIAYQQLRDAECLQKKTGELIRTRDSVQKCVCLWMLLYIQKFRERMFRT